MPDSVSRLHDDRRRVREAMGGVAKIAALHDAGRLTARELIAALVDPGSFSEVGTFVGDRDDTPADGKIAGFGRVDGRPVGIVADDVTVKRATSSLAGSRKIQRVYEQSERAGHPFVYLGATGGGRLPDTMGVDGFCGEPVFPWLMARRRVIPVVTAIVGDSFGGSSFVAGLSDHVVMTRAATLAVTSPRVVEIATGEQISMIDLGGSEVHERGTGIVDVVVGTDLAAVAAVRRWLGFLPAHGRANPPCTRPGSSAVGQSATEPDPGLAAVVPGRRRRAYDMHDVIARVVDDADLLETRPLFACSVITGLARIDGRPVGVAATNPKFLAGSLSPEACDKVTRLVVLCDAFNLPLVFLLDTPGFLVGRRVEHERLLPKAMSLMQAFRLAQVPRLTVVVRKAFGMAFFALGGTGQGGDLLVSWPGAEIGFMDPEVAANVLFGDLERAAELGEALSPMALADRGYVDEVIDPAETRPVLAEALSRFAAGGPGAPGPAGWGADRPLASWPAGW
jgi:methylmalonyl-CoA decarboxylase subunit alpha